MFNKTLYLSQLINLNEGEVEMSGKKEKYKGELDYEKIVIYPYEYDKSIRQKLYKTLKKLGICIECEQY